MSKSVVLPFVRSAYNYDRNSASDEAGLLCSDSSLTKQEFTEECDPNYIMNRFVQGADISLLGVNNRPPLEGDFTNVPQSYHAALNFVKAAESQFMLLDARVRAKFDNDPQKFINFATDPANSADLPEKLVSLGLGKSVEDLSPAAVDGPVEPAKAAGGKSGRKAPDDQGGD